MFVCLFVFWLCWLEPKQSSNYSAFSVGCLQESEIILLWKLSLDGKLRYPCFFLVSLCSWTGLRRRRWFKTTASPTQLSMNFCFSFTTFAGLVLVLILLCFLGRICIYRWRQKGSFMLLVHRIQPKRQGFTLPLGRISLSFFSRMITSPRCFWTLTGFPFWCRLYITIFCWFVWLWVCLIIFCCSLVNRSPVWLCGRVRVLNVCVQDTCFRLLSRGRAKRYSRYMGPSFLGHHQVRGA